MRPLILFFACYLICSASSAQELELANLVNYTKEDGLSTNNVHDIAPDEWGNLWVKIDGGVEMFDGRRFKPINFEHSLGHKIPQGEAIPKLLSNNTLALIAQDGVFLISQKHSFIRRLFIPHEKNKDFNYYSNRCFDVESDGRSNYGVSTYNGFYIFNADGTLIDRYDKVKPGENNRIWYPFGRSIYQLPNGDLAQQNNEGFFIYDSSQKKIKKDSTYSTTFNYLYREGYRKRNSFVQLPDKRILLFHSQENAVVLVNLEKNDVQTFKADFTVKDRFRAIRKCLLLNDTTVLIRDAYKTLVKLVMHRRSGLVTLPGELRLQGVNFFDFYLDKKNCLWLTSNNGIYREKKDAKVIEGIRVTQPARMQSSFFSILGMKKSGNNLFLATTSGIQIFNIVSKKITHSIDLSPVDPGCNKVARLMLRHNDTMWAGTAKGLIWLHTGNLSFGRVNGAQSIPGLNSDEISFLFEDSRKNVWIRTNRILPPIQYNHSTGAFSVVDRTDKNLHRDDLFHSYPSTAAEDNEGNIWFAGDYLIRFNIRLNHFDSIIQYLPGRTARLLSTSLLKDRGGKIWLADFSSGIYQFSSKGITEAPIMSKIKRNEREYNLTGSDSENIFFSYSGGIGAFKRSNDGYIIFKNEDGLPLGPFNSDFVADPESQTYYFNQRDFLYWMADSIISLKRLPPAIHFTEFEILDDSVIIFPPSSLTLSRHQNDIRISFGVANFTDPNNMTLSYRVRNKKDSTWIESSDDHSFVLSNISPGSYVIEIRAQANDNKWPDQIAQMQVRIRPAFWQTTWFFVLSAIAIAGVLYAFYRRRIRSIRRNANIDKQLAQLEMKGLLSQMNPHFVFNSLNSIREMILNNENKDASRYLSKFAHLIRITLDHSGQSLVSLRETTEYLERYIEMEQIRNPEFGYKCKTDERLDPEETAIPPMLVQPFIENALWHGVSPGHKDINIRVDFRKEGDSLVCIIDDDGIGINQSIKEKKESGIAHRPVGISNIRNRIALLNQKHDIMCSVSVIDKSEDVKTRQTGTLVVLKMPLEMKDE